MCRFFFVQTTEVLGKLLNGGFPWSAYWGTKPPPPYILKSAPCFQFISKIKRENSQLANNFEEKYRKINQNPIHCTSFDGKSYFMPVCVSE